MQCYGLLVIIFILRKVCNLDANLFELSLTTTYVGNLYINFGGLLRIILCNSGGG
jgi:hypothetical protein